MNTKGRVSKLEEKIKPEVKNKLFYSYEYESKAKLNKAIKDYKTNNPGSKLIIIQHIGSYENDAGEVTKKTMYKGVNPDD